MTYTALRCTFFNKFLLPDVPSPPVGPLGLYGINKDSITITWYPSERNGGSPILDYNVEMRIEGEEWKSVATVTTTMAKIQKLIVNKTYQFRIFARNEIGTSLAYESDERITIGKTLGKYCMKDVLPYQSRRRETKISRKIATNSFF